MSDKYTTQHGREVKKAGKGEAVKKGLAALKAAREGGDKRTDQYTVEETKKIFEEVDDEEYNRRLDKRKNDDFIVDDDGYGYRDHGGEIWDRDGDYDEGGKKKKKKSNQVDPNESIMNYMMPASTLKKKSGNASSANPSAQQKPQVSIEQSKDIMNNLFQQLDEKDVDELEDVNQAKNMFVQEMNKPVAFNKEEEFNNRYSVTLESRQEQETRRQSEQLKHEASIGMNQSAVNPFSKKRKLDEFQQPQQPVSSSKGSNQQQSNNTSYFDARSQMGDQEMLNQSDDRDQYQSALDDSRMTDSHPSQIRNQSQQRNSSINAQIQQQTNGRNQIDQVDSEWQKLKEKNANRNQEMRTTENQMLSNQVDHDLPLNEDGTLSFYWIDAHEEGNGAELYIFGKIYQKEERKFVSCSIKVNGMQRELFVLPKMKGKSRAAMTAEEEKEQARAVMMELDDIRRKRFTGITKWRCKPVTRKYAFELPIQHGEHQFLKIKYSATLPPLPSTVEGNTFECIFGSNQSILESFILKRKIRGPCWMTVKNPIKVIENQKKTWCKQEIIVNDPKDIEITLDDLNRQDLPPLASVTFAVKTCRSSQNTTEIAMISCVVNENIGQEGPSKIDDHRSFTLLRQLDGKMMPHDFERAFRDKKDSAISFFKQERHMLDAFVAKIYQIDPDLMIAHNLCGGMFDLLLARMSIHKPAHWSRIGRLKKNAIPSKKTEQGGANYGGSQWIPRQVTCGRLLVDTFLTAKELIRETNYDLSHLAKVQLQKDRVEFDDDLLPTFFVTVDKLFALIDHTEKDAYLTLQLMNHLQVIPLTKQLTNIAGNLWFRSLQNARAERNEMLLLHEFKKKKFVLPDKKLPNAKDLKRNFFADEYEEAEQKGSNKPGKRKKAAYAGGLVIEPKAGFYDNIILLLDFNSLYPSIIQEYNLCFTTVNRRPTKNFDGTEVKNKLKGGDNGAEEQEVEEADLPDKNVNLKDAVLPMVLRDLVQKRKAVKDKMKTEKDPVKLQQLEIRQKAIKLTANSMYGCLGFSSSRFHAQAIAALITRTGRETLLRTKDIAENKLGFNVVYGDTDSIMINTGSSQLQQALEMGKRLKGEVNVLYKCLEIEIDGVFKSLLLLKKKKYAALKYENFMNPADVKVVQEMKGLDMVRRDWCPLSKRVGRYVLDQILSGKQREEVVLNLNEFLSNIGQDLKEGRIRLNEFIITKQVTKALNDYNDIKAQPHVAVAKRMRDNGKSESQLVNNFIPYVICSQPFQTPTNNQSLSLSDKAYHPDEVLTSKGKASIDNDWYVSTQLLPPITRLIEHIDGIEVEFVAQCLGLDPKKYKYHSEKKSTDNPSDDPMLISNPVLQTETERSLKTRTVAELNIKCPHCSHNYHFPGIFHQTKSNEELTGLSCLSCKQRIPDAYLLNRLNLFLKQLTSLYYIGVKECKEPQCGTKTNQLLMNNKCIVKGCKGKMNPEYSELRINDTLRYLEGLFNVKKFLIENEKFRKKYERHDQVPNYKSFSTLQKKVDEFMGRSSYNKVDLGNIFSFMKQGTNPHQQKMSIF